MALKTVINGVSKRIITPLKMYHNGQWIQIKKGYTFINGQKVQIWGNTRLQMFSIPYTLGYYTDILYIDDDNMYTFGNLSGTITPINPDGTPGQPIYMTKSNCLCSFTISNPSSATYDGYTQWGQYPIFSPLESDDENYIYYFAKNSTRNKVKLQKGTGTSIVDTVTLSGSLIWCVPLANGHNLWVKNYVSGRTTYYQLGYDSTVLLDTSNGNGLYPVCWDNGNFVVGSVNEQIFRLDITGRTRILQSNDAIVTSKMLDGDNLIIAGYSSSAAKVGVYDTTNQTTIWEKQFSADRRPDIIGEGGGYYYVIDKPQDFNASDTSVYLRIYNASTGEERETTEIVCKTESNADIIGWKVFPVKAKNGVLPLGYLASSRLYICKVFTD